MITVNDNNANNITLTKYADPQGRFSISYPDGWNVQPVTDRFQTVLVTFANYPPARFDFLSLVVQSQNTNEIASTDPLVVLNNTSPPSFDWSLFQPIECAKYIVDGNKACTCHPSPNSKKSASSRKAFA